MTRSVFQSNTSGAVLLIAEPSRLEALIARRAVSMAHVQVRGNAVSGRDRGEERQRQRARETERQRATETETEREGQIRTHLRTLKVIVADDVDRLLYQFDTLKSIREAATVRKRREKRERKDDD